ncbi:PREDICTED: CD180 antigen [Nanorana parkeri]|uniref:CD180 antigen n=1 Tax=Nanorana parkeri TaxID=125878 RepID=UPI0008550361|nr:PREDICTED: CD180 antigen [Nanorana parkeri]
MTITNGSVLMPQPRKKSPSFWPSNLARLSVFQVGPIESLMLLYGQLDLNGRTSVYIPRPCLGLEKSSVLVDVIMTDRRVTNDTVFTSTAAGVPAMAQISYIAALLMLYHVFCKDVEVSEEPLCTEVIAATTYDCEGLGLQNLPDSLPGSTEYLDFSFNSLLAIYHFTFNRLEKLEYLALSRCGIAWIYDDAFSNNTKLNTLLLTGNNILYIADRAFLGATSLQHLYLQKTSISELWFIPMKTLPNLETLHVGSNYITDIQLPDDTPMTKLRTLNFELNQISRISVEDLNILKHTNNLTLILKGNNIEYIEPNAFNFSNLHCLDLTGSAWNVDLSSVLKGLNGLRADNLRIGTFIDIDVDKDVSLSDMDFLCSVSMKELSLQYRAFSDQHKSFPCLAKTEKLDFTCTNLKSFAGLSTDNILKELILNKNKFTSLCSISSDTYPQITNLHIARNMDTLDLGDGCLKSLTSLVYLDLSENEFMHSTCCSTHFRGLESLTFLNMSYGITCTLHNPALPETNKIEVLDFSHVPLLIDKAFSPFSNLADLKVLNLSNSYIDTSNREVFKGLQNLLFINMERSVFQNGVLADENLFANTLKLETLILAKCKLREIEDQAFKKLKQLKHVDLSQNNLTVFSTNLFVNLTYMSLNYAFNFITTIPIDSVRNISDQNIINFSHNPIDCSCSNIDFLSWYKTHMNLFLDKENTVCGSPPSLVGTELYKVSLSCGTSLMSVIILILFIVITIILAVCFIRLYRKRFYSSI